MPTAVNSVDNDNISVYAVDGKLHVMVAHSAAISIYNIQGAFVAGQEVAAGDNVYELPQGIYIVKVDNQVRKVVVR